MSAHDAILCQKSISYTCKYCRRVFIKGVNCSSSFDGLTFYRPSWITPSYRRLWNANMLMSLFEMHDRAAPFSVAYARYISICLEHFTAALRILNFGATAILMITLVFEISMVIDALFPASNNQITCRLVSAPNICNIL